MRKALLFACAVTVMTATTAAAQDPWAWSPTPLTPAPLVTPLPSLPSLPELPRLPGLSTPAPSSGSTYDWRSGNSYRWQRDFNGDTRVSGMNLYTGSMWRQTIKPDGSMTGTDSKMNPWRYDSKTKTYMNFGTGEMCVGSGASRYRF